MPTNNHAAERALAKEARKQWTDSQRSNGVEALADAIDRLCDEAEASNNVQHDICGEQKTGMADTIDQLEYERAALRAKLATATEALERYTTDVYHYGAGKNDDRDGTAARALAAIKENPDDAR
jgi:hypothetical protein